MPTDEYIIGPDEPILITGGSGFIGSRVVEMLLDRGFRNLVCFARPSGSAANLEALARSRGGSVRVVKGNLLSRESCETAAAGVSMVIHLAAGGSGKSYPDSYMNCVVTTRNLIEASLKQKNFKRFVNISSFAVYSNNDKPQGNLLDEACPMEPRPELRADPYCFAKVKQDELVAEYGKSHQLPYIIVRPGYVLGPGKGAIPSRVGVDTFGFFMHMGGSNSMPFTYVDNCAEAIVMASLKPGIEGEAFNIIDDNLPTSRQFLRAYKRNVKNFRSVYFPHVVSKFLCSAWEKYATWSQGQLPPAFNSRRWHAFWKKTRYSNQKLKSKVGWKPTVPMAEGLKRYFDSAREQNA